MRRHFIHDGEALVEVERQAPRPRVHIVGDSHTPFKSMADGRVYDSKSAYRRELRARGFEEVGNEFAAVTERSSARSDGVPELRQAASEMGLA